MKRRILSIALGITMLVGLLPATALAAETAEARWTTVVTGGTLTMKILMQVQVHLRKLLLQRMLTKTAQRYTFN